MLLYLLWDITPAQYCFFFKYHIPTAMIVSGNAPFGKPAVVRDLDLEDRGNVIFTPSVLQIGVVQIVVSIPCPLGAVILVVFRHEIYTATLFAAMGAYSPSTGKHHGKYAA